MADELSVLSAFLNRGRRPKLYAGGLKRLGVSPSTLSHAIRDKDDTCLDGSPGESVASFYSVFEDT